ncbi:MULTISPECIES: rhodanese-like domain-containing protein [Acidithiobacillus]|jgi:rhodanese-related sulfurtransferase|uniref:Rhodanese domain protein n=3 Tax=Acidithiobacillus caldus TaxID=33059 RepID=F9ZQH7_ACICS|nr:MULTISPECIES: rhodanese-like domain-containing protein [Acidithiobacillus]AEK58394.1 Rhodanese domain protein [Acidithiobacillus caldus SM-1]AIA55362.1 Rhodanese-related sulfurtransferase [Acidithiobacillus caldus ATCC 51756]AUW32990.1 rhodanese-like domain-containing protein [Acidithiobacillus caldus]MBU2729567.1 rhodanese-like domain-containing protein [Acidithiobacillus caldus]MBU2734914.1 rhodanese-like domain-containing protein [Acidithiobacillus caldus ATCC 51756]
MADLGSYLSAHWPLILVVLAVLALLFKGPIVRKLAGIEEIAPENAVRLINDHDAVVIDVREMGEWSRGHLPGARHIPLGEVGKYLPDLRKHQEHHVICQCASGMRSARAAGILKKAGFTKVYSLKGGIAAWRSAGLPVEKD